MNLFTRITATLGTTADSAVSRFENHDAIAQSALVRARQAMTKARIRYNHLRSAVDGIRSRLDSANHNVEQWTSRARKLAASDEQKRLNALSIARAAMSLSIRSIQSWPNTRPWRRAYLRGLRRCNKDWTT